MVSQVKTIVVAFMAGWAVALILPMGWTAPVVVILLCIFAIIRISS